MEGDVKNYLNIAKKGLPDKKRLIENLNRKPF